MMRTAGSESLRDGSRSRLSAQGAVALSRTLVAALHLAGAALVQLHPIFALGDLTQLLRVPVGLQTVVKLDHCVVCTVRSDGVGLGCDQMGGRCYRERSRLVTVGPPAARGGWGQDVRTGLDAWFH